MVAHVNDEGETSYPQWWIPRNRHVKDVCVGARQGSGVWVFFTVDLTFGKEASTSTLDLSKPWRRVRVLVFNEREVINPVTGERSPSPLVALSLNWQNLASS